MAFGHSGIVLILRSLAQGKLVDKLALTEWPNMPFMYWLAVVGALLKPKWTSAKKLPALEVCCCVVVACRCCDRSHVHWEIVKRCAARLSAARARRAAWWARCGRDSVGKTDGRPSSLSSLSSARS